MFQFQLVRLKLSQYTTPHNYYCVSIPTGSIKIHVRDLLQIYYRAVSIPTGSIKIMLSPTMHRLKSYVSIPTGSIKIDQYR